MYEHICYKCGHIWFDHKFNRTQCPDCECTEFGTQFVD